MQVVRQFILHIFVLSVVLFIAFCKMENIDLGVVILGFILYLPFVLLLAALNIFLLSLGVKNIRNKHISFVIPFFTSILLLTWFLLNGNQITIVYWTLTSTQFLVLNIVLVILNIWSVFRLTTGQKNIKRKDN
jgi:hypothetical protein